METLVIFAVIWFVGRLIASAAKKSGGAGGGNKQRQAVEEQRRRREAYEAAQSQEAQPQEAPPRVERPQVLPQQAAQKARQAQRMQELAERFGSPPQRAQKRTVQRPKTLTQVQRQLYAPMAPPEGPPVPPHHIDEIEEARCAEATLSKQQVAPAMQARHDFKTADAPALRIDRKALQPNMLVQGIIMAEILGPPRSKSRCRSQK